MFRKTRPSRRELQNEIGRLRRLVWAHHTRIDASQACPVCAFHAARGALR